MPMKSRPTSVLTLATVAGILIAPIPGASASDQRLRFTMHDMMPMQPQAQGSGSMSGGMEHDMSRMPQSQSGQTGGTPSSGQSGPSGRMDDNMRMQPQNPSDQMGGGMQSRGQMGQGGSSTGPGSMGGGGMSGQPGGMMNNNMMQMMTDHMRMMNDQMRMRGTMPGTAMGPGMVDMTDRFEGRLAFLRAELRITEGQASTWSMFADELRASRNHLLEARQMLNQPNSRSADRLEHYERHLTARLAALRSARQAFGQLYASLDDLQKRTADELVVPLIATF